MAKLKTKNYGCTSKPKLIVYIGRSQKFFESDSNPENSSERIQKVQNGPKSSQIKNKKNELHLQNKQTLIAGSKNVFEADPYPKNSLKEP